MAARSARTKGAIAPAAVHGFVGFSCGAMLSGSSNIGSSGPRSVSTPGRRNRFDPLEPSTETLWGIRLPLLRTATSAGAPLVPPQDRSNEALAAQSLPFCSPTVE